MLQLVVIVVTLFLDLYIAERYSKKYNVTQNSIIKYKELNEKHKKKIKLTATSTMPFFMLVAMMVGGSGINKIIEFISYCLAVYFIALASWDLYYRKGTNSFKLTLNRNIYVYSFCFLLFISFFLFS